MKRNKALRAAVMLFVGVAMLIVAQPAFGAVVPAADGDWTTGATWDTGQEPNSSEDVTVQGGYAVEVTTSGAVANNLRVTGTDSTLTLTSGDLTSTEEFWVYNGGTFINNGGTFVSNGSGINYVGNYGEGWLIVNAGSVDLTAGTFRTSQESSGGPGPRAHIEIHGTGHLTIDGTALFSVRGGSTFTMTGGEFDAVNIDFTSNFDYGQFSTFTLSGGQFDISGSLGKGAGGDWRSRGQVEFTVEGSYGDGSRINVGKLDFYGDDDPVVVSGRENRLTALIDAGGIEPINVLAASTLAHTTLTNMELAVGAMDGEDIGDITGVYDFVISTGPIDVTDLVFLELASLTDIGGLASYAIVANGGGTGGLGETLQLTITRDSLPGDADGNDVVDGADYIALKANIGQATGATTADGDFDNDGDVDWDDLAILQDHFGETSSASTPIPEPCSMLLLLGGAAALLRRRTRAL